MKVTGMLKGQIDMVAMSLSLKVYRFKQLSGETAQFTVRPETGSDRFRRLNSLRSRRLAAACFHGYEAFMLECFRINPHAKFRTALASYDGLRDFHDNAYRVGNVDIGHRTRYDAACMCEGAS